MTLSIRERRPARREDVWLRQSGKENVLYNPATQEVHLLNDTALAIWQLCDGQTLPEEMIGAICEISGLPQEVVAEDVARILAEFEQAQLIKWME